MALSCNVLKAYEKCLSWISIRPNEDVVDLVTSPIFLLQIVVKFIKGLCFFSGRNCRISGDGTVVKFGENYFDGSQECHCPSHGSLEAECIYV